MLILDEPTNHLDVDAREALVQALNDYAGAVVIVSHDRHMLELTADRLVLVDDGTAREFTGSLDDYIALILGRDGGSDKPTKKKGKAARDENQALRQRAKEAEAKLANLNDERDAVDRQMTEPGRTSMGELMKRRSALDARIEEAEAEWLAASEALEMVAA